MKTYTILVDCGNCESKFQITTGQTIRNTSDNCPVCGHFAYVGKDDDSYKDRHVFRSTIVEMGKK